MASLKQLALRGAIWTFIGYGLSNVIRLASNLVLTRLLVPEYFGLMALVYTFITGLTLFSDIGLGPSVIQNKRGTDPDFLNTAWTLQVMRGVLLWLGCVLIAWPVANIYSEPQLLLLIPVIGLTTILNGLESMALHTLNREVAMGKVMIFEIGVQSIGTIATVLLAWINPSVWALVMGTLIGNISRTVLSHTSLPHRIRHRFHWDKPAVDDIISFGKWIFFSTAVTFLATQSDRLLLGKFAPLSFLGIYTIAFTLGDLPRKVSQQIYAKVLFPVMAKVADSPRAELRRKIMKSRQLALIGLMMIVVVLASGGDLIINFLYTEDYSEAGWILSVIALGLWPNLLADTLSPCLFAIGQPRYLAFGNFFSFLFILAGIPLAFSLLPEELSYLGAVGVVALSELPFYIAIAIGLVHENLSCLKQDLAFTSLLIVILTGVISLRLSLGLGTPLDPFFAS